MFLLEENSLIHCYNYKLGGIQSGTTENIYPTAPTEIIDWKIHDNASTGIQFSKIMPALNISIRF